MAITHGDLLLQRVHKHNSLDHLTGPPGSRPGSAARSRSRPNSAASSRSGSRPNSAARGPPSRSAASSKPQSAQLPYRSNPVKTELQKKIDGDTGPAMIGVSSYPYSRPQSAYREDFEMLVTSTITHPYIRTTDMTEGSAPHNLLTGACALHARACPCATRADVFIVCSWRSHGRRHSGCAGSNFAPTYDYWASEYKRMFVEKSYKQSFNTKAMGLRSEELIFVG